MPSFEPVITKGTATAPEQSFRPITYDPQETIETEGSYNYKSKGSSNNINFQPKTKRRQRLRKFPVHQKMHLLDLEIGETSLD